MTDDRARRSAVLNAAAKAKSRAKTSAAEQAIRALVKRGEAVTFEAVCREARVSPRLPLRERRTASPHPTPA